MHSTKALYWAGAIGVAVVAVAGLILAPRFANVWPSAQNAPSAVGGAASSSGSAASTTARPNPAMVAQPTPSPLAQPARTSAETAAASGTPLAETAAPNPAGASATVEPKAAAPAAAPVAAAAGAPIEPAPERPGFDVVRVEPAGDTVVAGHATPNAAVELRDEGRVIAEIDADKSGQFVILPPPLPEGRHRLELAARSGGAPAVVSEAVTVEVAAQKPGSPRYAPPPLPRAPPTPTARASSPQPPIAAATASSPQPPTPTATASSPQPTIAAATASSPQPTIAAATPAPKAVAARIPPILSPIAADDSVRVYVRTVEATAAGQLLVKGSAEANAIVRLYLNGSFLADASAGQDRQWSLTIEHGMSPGLYTIRADEIDRSSGAVLARAEVPFSYPQHPSATVGSLAAAPVAQAASAARAPLPSPSPTSRVAAGEAAEPAIARPAASAAPAPTAPIAPQSEPTPTSAANPASPKYPAPAAPAPIAPIVPQSGPTPTSAANPASPPPPASATPTLPVSPAQTSNPSPSATPPTDVVVAEVQTTIVVRGDNLWDLARHFYGDGMRFRQIYAANASQIRDPSLIYIGQIFVVPKEPPP